MDDENAHAAEGRAPEVEDLVILCRRLNELGAQYLVVGGFAIIQAGFPRATMDIDILVASSLENQALVRTGLEILPEKAILELGPDEDLRDWVVLRVADEVVVDIMLSACGIPFEETLDEHRVSTIDGVPIPFASPKLLLRMKQTHRAKDEEDRIFLHYKIAQEEGRAGPPPR